MIHFEVGMKFEITNFFSNVFLFKSVSKETIEEILNEVTLQIIEFKSREIIYSPNDYEEKIGFIISGECTVEQIKSDGKKVPLNTLSKGDSFGVLAVLSDKPQYPTLITATKDSAVVFVTKNELFSILEKCPTVSKNLIKFLCERINFLTEKISTFTSSTAEDKLANFLFRQYLALGNLEFPFNCQKTTKALNMGRASLYRAIAALSEANVIKQKNKTIKILNLNLLKRS